MEEVSIEEEGVSQELELERLQNAFLKKENEDLESKLAECKEELVEVKEKDTKINSLMRLNEGLDEDKKEMDAKNNEQQRTISDQEKRIREQEAFIKSLIDKNKDINEAVKKDNEDLQAQVTKLKENLSVKEKESTEQLEKINCLQQKETELKQERKEDVELKDRINALNSEKEEQFKAMKEERKMHEESQRELERKLESLGSQLRTAEVEKKSSENEVARLQEQVRILEGNKEWELAGIGDTLNKTSLSVMELLAQQLPLNNQEQQLQGKKVDLIERLKAELKKESDEALQEKLAEQEKLIKQLQKEQKQVESQLEADIKKLQGEKENMEEQLKIMQQQLLNNQEQQKLEEKLKGVDKRLEDIDEETQKSQGQTKTKASDTVSLVSAVSTGKSTTSSSRSTLSKLRNLPNKLFRDKNLDDFLSDKNKELKENFPEFKEKHFCHNVLDETIKSLSNKNSGKFESKELLKLLESNLKQSAREIIEAKVKEVVNKHCIEKNIGKELRDDTLKAKLLTSVKQCMKKLNFNEKDAVATRDSILHSFNSKNNNNNDSGELLKEIVVKELVEARMRFFSDKIQELQLTSSIRDKFLSPDQKMCNQTQGGVNEYQLTEKAKKEYTPNSSMSHTNIASIHSLNSRKAVRVGS